MRFKLPIILLYFTSPKKLFMKKFHVLVSRLFILAVANFVLIVFFSSCTQEVPPKGTVCIPVPQDTSALAKKNHFIPKSQIDAFRKEYLLVRESIIRSDSNLFIPESEDFNKAAILKTLEDPKCTGIRIYYGVKKGNRNEIRLIIVGIDAQGNDLYYIVQEPLSAVKQDSGVYGQGEKTGGNEWGNCHPPCRD
jgi:hypothetical protein